jgi:hypothetical protein
MVVEVVASGTADGGGVGVAPLLTGAGDGTDAGDGAAVVADGASPTQPAVAMTAVPAMARRARWRHRCRDAMARRSVTGAVTR